MIRKFQELLQKAPEFFLWVAVLAGTSTYAYFDRGEVSIALAVLVASGIILFFSDRYAEEFSSYFSSDPGIVIIEGEKLHYHRKKKRASLAIPMLEALRFDQEHSPPGFFLEVANRPNLFIPQEAEGMERLAQALQHLPGMDHEAFLELMLNPPSKSIILWERQG